jgi:hypothetical protein
MMNLSHPLLIHMNLSKQGEEFRASQKEKNAEDVTSSSGNNSYSAFDYELKFYVVDETVSFQEVVTSDA